MVDEMKTYFDKIVVGGLMFRIELERDPKAKLDDYLKKCKELTERTLVWTTCPKCGRDVPQIDMTIFGYCFYCMKEENEKGDETNGT